MSTIITVCNIKGGVGKTTVAAQLAFAGAARGLRTLAIDLDVSLNLSRWLIGGEPTGDAANNAIALFAPIEDDDNLQLPEPIATSRDKLMVIPGAPNIQEAERGTLATVFDGRNRIRALGERFDLVVIDTPPTTGVRVQAALGASRRAVCPMDLGTFAVTGLKGISREIAVIRRDINHGLEPPKYVMNLADGRTSAHRQVITALQEQIPGVLGPLGRRISLMTAAFESASIWELKSDKAAEAEWTTLVDALLPEVA